MRRHVAYDIKREWLLLSVRGVLFGEKYEARSVVTFDELLDYTGDPQEILDWQYGRMEAMVATSLDPKPLNTRGTP